MKKILFIILMMLSILPAAEAQNVVGRWRCSEEFLHSLGTRFIQMRGRYCFKKDSTFTIKIKGRGQRLGRKPKNKGWSSKTVKSSGIIELTKRPDHITSKHTLQIKVKGTYSVSDGTITTKVAPEGVSCYIDSGRDMPEMPSVDSYDYDYEMLVYLWESSSYNDAAFMSRTQEKTIKREFMKVWNWNREPLEVTKKTMTVGNKVTFRRK